MVKAVIFDCFGVLVLDSLGPVKKKYFQGTDAEWEPVDEAIFLSSRGDISYLDFVDVLNNILKIDKGVLLKELDINPRNVELLDFIRTELKSNYKIGFLSNAAENWLDDLFLPEDLELFDDIVLSGEVGYAKPEAIIYEIAATNLGVRADECLFVDDTDTYIQGAKGVGMKCVAFQNTSQAVADIQAHL